MKSILLALICVSVVYAVKLDTVVVTHKRYVSVFDTIKHYPLMVSWYVSRKSLDCSNKRERQNNFRSDPLVNGTDVNKYYAGSGYDRGHNMPSADNLCDSVGQVECFYFTNIMPQSASLNRGAWKSLEDRTRDLALQYDSIKVWCGGIGQIKKIGTVSVPLRCWKIIYVRKLKSYECRIFNNYNDSSYVSTVARIQKLTNLKIK